jgi:pyrroline-5-carboxylate reductase
MFDRILLFGYGAMASAMLEGWLASGLEPGRFTVYNPRSKPAPDGVVLTTDLPDGAYDAVILGVKPQALPEVADTMEPLAGPDTLVRRFPRARAHARAMPNLAAAIGQSPCALVARGASEAQRAPLTDLAARLGGAEWFEDEAQFDLLTALIGSGPAFVYRFIEALAQGAAELGLEEERAARLATRMAAGAAALAAASPHSAGELTRRVASPGGTTRRGLDVLDEHEALQSLLTRCLAAARDRGRELAEEARGG